MPTAMKTPTKIAILACLLGLSGCSSLLPASWTSSSAHQEAAEPALVAPRAPAPMASASVAAPAPALVLHESARRTPVTATGYAVIAAQNAKSPAQQRLLAIRAARLDAYRGLAEQVYGVYLDASTTVGDLVLKSDTYRARVEGVIHGAVLSAITPINNDTYEVTLTLDRDTVSDLRKLYVDFLGRAPAH